MRSSPPEHSPRLASSPRRTGQSRGRRRQTPGELRDLHRLALKAISRPLTPGWQMRRTWFDGRPTREIVESFIKPNDRLKSIERLELYNKQYWFRLLDCLYDDYPGLRAILGQSRFRRLSIAYLDKYPSNSYTLRDLGNRLEKFLLEHPHWGHPREQMVLDMARFEWAQVVAFDGEVRPALSVDDLLGQDPATLRLEVQPYLTLLELNYPLDDFVIAVKKRDAALRGEASNAVDTESPSRSSRKTPIRRPRPEKVWLAVHRLDNAIYYKRLTADAFAILAALRDGKTLARACAQAAGGSADPAEVVSQIGQWFGAWAELGWFCKR
jgi:hypothetical protein